MRTLIVTALLASLTGIGVTATAQQPLAVEASFRVAELGNRDNMPPVAPLQERVTLSAEPSGPALPDGLAEPRFGTLQLGEKKVSVVVARTKADAEAPDVLLVDRDADGALEADERLALEVTERERRNTKTWTSAPVEASFALGGREMPARITYMKLGEQPASLSVAFLGYLAGEAEVAGKPRVVAVLDKDFDGSFGSAGDMWTLAAPGGRPANAFALSALGERCFVDGHRVGIRIEGDTIQLVTEAAAGPDPEDAAAHRERVEHLWAERFDSERESFVAARGLDTSRATTDQPVKWHYVTFAEGLALAKETGKPLFVDVMAFWCVWCYRMDYYTYCDAEVSALLRDKFVPIKIIQEQDLAGDYELVRGKLEARGIPAMGVFSADGELLHKISGWKKPEDFVAELNQALEAR